MGTHMAPPNSGALEERTGQVRAPSGAPHMAEVPIGPPQTLRYSQDLRGPVGTHETPQSARNPQDPLKPWGTPRTSVA